jgi:hypothetical protein
LLGQKYPSRAEGVKQRAAIKALVALAEAISVLPAMSR